MRFAKSPCMHLTWMQGDYFGMTLFNTFGKVILCPCKVTLHLSHLTWMQDNTPPMSPHMHLLWMQGDYFRMRCYFGGIQTSNDEDFQKFYWWLVRGTLLMELGLLCDFFENFSMRGERYLEGAHKVDMR